MLCQMLLNVSDQLFYYWDECGLEGMQVSSVPARLNFLML